MLLKGGIGWCGYRHFFPDFPKSPVFGLLLTTSQQSTPKQGSPRRKAPTGSHMWSNTTVVGSAQMPSPGVVVGPIRCTSEDLRSRATLTEASDEYDLGHVQPQISE